MFAIIIGLIVIALVVTLLLKGYYPQAILFMGGVGCSHAQLSLAGAICSMPNRRRTLSALIFSKSSALAFHPASPV